MRESNSSLAHEINRLTIDELLISLEVANEMDSDLTIRNIGLLMFSERPDRYIPGALINLVHFHHREAEASDEFTEKTFVGPIWKQIRDVLNYINVNVIKEKVVKINNKAESIRYYNYPYNAIEELLVNSVFHKSYYDPEPVEIRIYVDSMQIINFPGPAKWIDMEKFKKGTVRARKYRNRRIGEFLKEIDLSEKQSTGITKVLKELRKNKSPFPEFETDEDRTYLITTLRARKGFENEGINSISEEIITENEGINSKSEEIIIENEGINPKSEEIIIENEGINSKNEEIITENEGINSKSEEIIIENEGINSKSEEIIIENEGINSKSEEIIIENEGINSKSEEIIKSYTIKDRMINTLGKKEYEKIELLILFLEQKDTITSSEAQKILNKSISTVLRYLNQLIDKEVLIKEGKSKGAVYKLNKNKFPIQKR